MGVQNKERQQTKKGTQTWKRQTSIKISRQQWARSERGEKKILREQLWGRTKRNMNINQNSDSDGFKGGKTMSLRKISFLL